MVGLAPEPLPTDLRQITARRPANPVPFVQGFYYVLVGLTPLLAGGRAGTNLWPDSDSGMQRAIGLIVAAVGVLLLAAARKGGAAAETGRVAVATAVVLAVADVAFFVRGMLPNVYLLDAVIQVGFVCWWARSMHPNEPLFSGRSVPMSLA
jgi:hypothetical protein